jgi:hypothetical protein
MLLVFLRYVLVLLVFVALHQATQYFLFVSERPLTVQEQVEKLLREEEMKKFG